jgi:hypothetical protein
MRRRDFLRLSLLASGSSLSGSSLSAARALASPDTTTPTLRLTINPRRTGNPIPPNFTGLSYESAQLSDPTFFSAENTALISFVRRLGASGVLRIGGNTSEYCFWTPKPSAKQAAPEAVGPDTGKQPAAPRQITPLAVRNLAAFIDATGWQLIYGLNMGSGTAEAAADQADYVMKNLGEKLIAFQLCNEPDLFAKNGLRKPGYNFDQFATEWQHFYDVIRKRVPNAPFAGPDTAFNNEWLRPFAGKFRNEVKFLSQHYYAEGPPTDPSMTLDRLLRPNPKLEAEFAGMQQTKKETGLPFRLAETNSCYSAGKQGVSDTFASALWAPDLMYQLATAGGEGINFHGGGDGWYTPIAGSLEQGFSARPIYYGMLLFAQAGAGQLVDTTIDHLPQAPLLTAYALRTESGWLKAAVFNKNQDRAVRLTIEAGQRVTRATALSLTAPAIDATTGVTLGGAAVGLSGTWSASEESPLPAARGAVLIDLPAASGALITLENE